ncbi:hypothetical protein GLX27_004307 [Malassezia furfur]|uniref:BZIP domain-containing protein n=1 Tax=Malassezia furfur TaxID=55194 RepID=A0ABY8F1P1_MALFU|nr:hypothetical protein GLX27_004307 [Malassezia furfur]
MLRSAPVRTRRARFDDEDASSSPPLAGEDEEALLDDFWRSFDQTKFLRELDAYTHHAQAMHPDGLPAPAPAAPRAAPPRTAPLVSVHAAAPTPTPAPAPAPTPPTPAADIPGAFYAQVIQILTFVLGSNPPMLADSAGATPRTHTWDAHAPHAHELTPDDWKTMHNVVTLMMEHVGGTQPAPSTLVTTHELTHLLQKLMAMQRADEQHHPRAPPPFASPLAYTPTADVVQRFLTTDLAEDEEDDDPDFQPPTADPRTLSPAWRRALQDLSAAPLPPLEMGAPASPAQATRARKRAALGDTPAPPRAASPPRTVPLPPLPPLAADPAPLAPLPPPAPEAPRRGRRAIYTAEEARERKRERNRQHMRLKRSGARTASPPPAPPDDALVRDAEIRFLRAEVERLRAENAQLRGREEMRQYAAQMGLAPPLPSLYENERRS